jgi:NAD(P)-dependent dehydrogenase (short-subunit alcohol dehydrogenase family)
VTIAKVDGWVRSILITGVSSGIGLATARHFLDLGWRVIGTVRSAEDAVTLEQVGEGRFSAAILDLHDSKAIERLAHQVSALLRGAPLDVLCNNAGTSVPAATAYQSVDGFSSAVELNLIAPFAVTRALYPVLAKPGGRIVFIGSLAGSHPLPFCAAYSAAKHGIEALAGSLRVELAPYGIETIVIAPGSVRTAIGDKIGSSTQLEGLDSEFAPAFARMAVHMGQESAHALPPEAIARLVEIAATAKSPKGRYVATPGYWQNWLLPRLMGQAWRDRQWLKRLEIQLM